ncbi:hypothetical protein [Herbaspirillum sp.]|uniref:hypothetical protein n=1 Tax=Herbaspirillum sp. TaxID=1890675 RepID=UPI00257D4D8F|nr:hypothetical protein [Herbaspirillum sp.]|tara:strand:+ start:5403 stop:5843 length:441 start_codon:yes stop_codon:yes gene_type:complete
MKKLAFALPLILSACAHIEFETDKGFVYYEPQPYVMVSRGADCNLSTKLITLPGAKRHLQLKSGYGSAELSVTAPAGIITVVGQKTDTQLPETITAVTGLLYPKSAALVAGAPAATDCSKDVFVSLYKIDEKGNIDKNPAQEYLPK